VAKALLIKASTERHLILCCREIQSSIKESSHRLLKDQIELMGMGSDFEVQERSIRCLSTGSEFIFEGLFRNVNRIKSMEGVTICWVEEAEKVSAESWKELTPTIRKEGSEIWVTFNPQFEDDPTYQMFVVSPPYGAMVVQVNYVDNPWFPEVLRQEMEQDKARDPVLYEQKWLGRPKGAGRRIWSAFHREHLIQEIPMGVIRDQATCYMGMDPHSKYYPFCLWVAVLPKNRRGRWPEDFHKHVYAEWPTQEDLGGPYHELRHKMLYTDSLADMAREIQMKDGAAYGVGVKARFIDTRFAKGAGGSNWSTSTEGVVAQFAKRENGGLLFQMPAERIIDVQREAIHSDMLFDLRASRGPLNEPSFSVDPSCKNLIASLVNHRLEEDSEKESEKYKDASDALRIAYAGIATRGQEDFNEDEPSGLAQFQQRVRFV
jgi:hypothetical protein